MAIVVLLTAIATTASAAATAPSAAQWEKWLHLPGVFDLAGPRADGLLVAAAHSRLSLLSTSGFVTDFAPEYSAPDGSESYIAMSPGLTVVSAGCSFARDDVFALDLKGTPPGVARITAAGSVSRLATVAGASTLSGITFDTLGDFGHRLLVIGPSGSGHTAVEAIDCRGSVTPVGTVATSLEGGIAVAPRGFGRFAGQLIAANEVAGSVYAVSSVGQLQQVAASGVPAGGDIGVESVGFVPATGAVAAYVADRATPGNPHPGTDSVLRLGGAALAAGGVQPGELLVATEGGDTLVGVRYNGSCVATVLATGPPTAHGEGRLLIVAAPTTASAGVTTPGPDTQPAATAAGSTGHTATAVTLSAVAVVLVSGATVAVALARRRRPRT
ncbi:MAG TPA: hypothetical protein VI316_01975 [Candidatus Dormibacteraeota bacterium]